MDTPFVLPTNSNNIRILHITDTHLFSEESGCLLGVPTNASFVAVIDEIKRQASNFDLIIATGDFVQDGSRDAYFNFARKIKEFSVPCFWLPGNHDIYHDMKFIFEQQNLPEKKVIQVAENWLIIMLNSQVPEKAYGLLSDSELAFLSTTLAKYSAFNVAIFLHHHPIMSGCQWLDQHCLKNSHELGALVKQYSNIKSIAWGHIHQKMDTHWHGCKVFSTPSTCVQFKPLCEHFTLSIAPPGWRFIELNSSGQVSTTVHCLNDNLFLPDMTKEGY